MPESNSSKNEQAESMIKIDDATSNAEKVSHSCAFRTMILFQVLAYGSYSVLVHLCEQNGLISFSSTTMNFIIEISKLFMSIVGEYLRPNQNFINTFQIKTWFRQSLPYSIPGLLYFINNNLAVHMQLQMDPASYQILSNFKIVTTAVLYRLIIKEKLTRRQWFAVSLLFCGGLSYSLGTLNNSTTKSSSESMRMYIRPMGLPMIFCYCTISGLAGVYNEWILKKHYSESLHIQNIYLYTYGSILNLVPAVAIPYFTVQSFRISNIIDGFSVFTWMIVFSQALNGLFMSVVIKHASNIYRLFVIAFALIVTAVLSVLFLSLTLNSYFFVSFIAMMSALYLYYFN